MAELAGLAAACFLAATLIPLPSEAALFAYLHHPDRAARGMTSDLIGRLMPPRELNPRAMRWLRRWLRTPWPAAPAFMAAGRLARYVVVAYFS
jgi:membrane protein YqaA with SNARE-associated domain